ncbi:MAG: pyridoxal-phosphate dependent enzyme, partial [Bacteroidaceae bacterium]
VNPKVKIYGVQAAGASSMKNSVLHGKIERLPTVSTIADGIAVKEPGQYTFDICRHYLDGIVTVTDDEISTAILTLMEKHKLVAEGAGAAAVAAALFGKIPVEGRKTICLVSGGNIDVNILSRVINRGLQTTGRSCVLTIELLDKPGQLRAVTSIVAEMGANILSVYHERSGNSIEVNGCFLRMTLETRDYGHIEAIKRTLSEAGFLLINN